jgi:protoheme IX farnesyltransferase
MSIPISVRNINMSRVCIWKEGLSIFLALTKIRISLLATLTTAAGYILATGTITLQMLVTSVAASLVACGSCALNQYQEREVDRWMDRTKSRPLPSGRLNPEAALWISIGLILLGSLILFFGAGDLALALGLFAVLWYNLIYTPLKQKTAFAAVPGALVGAIPPALGWTAGGGEIFDPRIAGVALFFFIWQIPHFWLLLLDVSKDYENVSLPSITKIFSQEQIKRIVFVWLLSTGASSLIIPLFGFLNSSFFYFLLVAAAFWLFWNAVMLLRSDGDQGSWRASFMKLNVHALLVISILSADRLLNS